jgi:hypothetical protein
MRILHRDLRLLGLVALLIAAFLVAPGTGSAQDGPSFTHHFVVSTQGPPWPPSEVTDANGDFVVVGDILTEVAPGQVIGIPGAALVSKDTVPPLDANGREDFSNPMGAPYQVIRHLDLSRGSNDLKIELYTNSFGPSVGNFGGGPRIPRQGENRYNLNMLPATCPDFFPTQIQETSYTLPSFPLHLAPVWGFSGDQVSYEVDSGDAYTPRWGSGSQCPPDGCLGEDIVNHRRQQPITLGEYMRQRGRMKVTLTRFDPRLDAYTHARFEITLDNLLPSSMYTVWGVRLRTLLLGVPPNPLRFPNVVITDRKGAGKVSYEVRNPFPDAQGPQALLRLLAVGVAFHPDFQNWGGCFGRIGAGVDISGGLLAFGDNFSLTDLVTKEPIP